MRNCRLPELRCRRLTARPPEFCAQRVLLLLAALLCTGVSALLPAAASRAQGAAAHSSRAALLSAAPTAAPALATLAAERRRSRAGVALASVSKGQLVDAISEKAGVSKKTAAAVLGSALDVIVESVANGDRVSLVGFGTFDSKERAAREGRNPQTGEKMQLAGARATPRRLAPASPAAAPAAARAPPAHRWTYSHGEQRVSLHPRHVLRAEHPSR